jgi:2-polyprenyl-6-methoxyphenol hydroxylase-like FAD-dependent oxidoreductase
VTAETDVLVVGAGPTGLAAALLLVRLGLSVRIIDKADAPSPLSRAIGVQARTLEVLAPLGVSTELISRGLPLRGATMWAGDEPIARIDLGDLDTRYPYILCIAQAETEAALARALEGHGGAIERGVELLSLFPGDDHVRARVRTSAGLDEIEASWVLGCDGAHSVVRKAIGLDFTGHTFEEAFLFADVRASWEASPDRVSTFLAEDGVLAAFPMRGGLYRLVMTAPDGLPSDGRLELAAIEAVARARSGLSIRIEEALGLGAFRIHSRQVDHYRVGRVFLAGDAAHIHSPVGGQGMNTGIQDVHNLASKVALVHRGWGRAALLDSYEAERRPIARAVLAATDAVTRFGTMKGALIRRARNAGARLLASNSRLRRRIATEIAELSVSYRKSPIVADRRAFRGPLDVPRAGDRIPSVGETFVHPADVTVVAFANEVGNGLSPAFERVAHRFGRGVRFNVVSARARTGRNVHDAIVTVIADPSGVVARAYRASPGAVLALRPDSYVGYRSHTLDAADLARHLETILIPRASFATEGAAPLRR